MRKRIPKLFGFARGNALACMQRLPRQLEIQNRDKVQTVLSRRKIFLNGRQHRLPIASGIGIDAEWIDMIVLQHPAFKLLFVFSKRPGTVNGSCGDKARSLRQGKGINSDLHRNHCFSSLGTHRHTAGINTRRCRFRRFAADDPALEFSGFDLRNRIGKLKNRVGVTSEPGFRHSGSRGRHETDRSRGHIFQFLFRRPFQAEIAERDSDIFQKRFVGSDGYELEHFAFIARKGKRQLLRRLAGNAEMGVRKRFLHAAERRYAEWNSGVKPLRFLESGSSFCLFQLTFKDLKHFRTLIGRKNPAHCVGFQFFQASIQGRITERAEFLQRSFQFFREIVDQSHGIKQEFGGKGGMTQVNTHG